MSIFTKITHPSHSRGNDAKRANRALARAMASAPTRSSREELIQLQNMGR